MNMGPTLLEGPDGSGKSTLAEVFALEFDQPILKNGPPPSIRGLSLEKRGLVTLYRNQLRQSMIIDRSWPSELIYGPRLRGQSLVGPSSDVVLTKFLAGHGRMILCLPPFEACLEAWQSRRGLELVKEEAMLLEVWNAYTEWATPHRGEPWFLVYDRTAPGATESAVKWLNSTIRRRKKKEQ